MALHNLKITVVDGGRQSGGGFGSTLHKANDNSESGNSILHKILNFNNTIKSSVQSAVSPTTFFALQSGVSVAAQTARQFINYYLSDIGRSNGDGNYQSIVGRRIEQWTDGFSVMGGAISGAAAGSVGGGIGAVIGGVVGAASAGLSLGFKHAERARSYQHEMFRENNSQAYQLARANYSAMSGRVR